MFIIRDSRGNNIGMSKYIRLPFYAFILWFIFCATLSLSFLAALVWVAYHFLAKVW